ncbi:MAG: hypothetical protein ABFC67_14840 [Mizugakiibacter sp.]|uniref:hypothetical protein n=1 Tax=Mizugakiibacter sp. TaxID=1972610 RepID=UPI003210FE5C
MKILTINTPNDKSQYALDTVRSVHMRLVDAAIQPGQIPLVDHVTNLKWLLYVEMRPVKRLDAEGKGQVVDVCDLKEWLFDTREELEAAVSIDTV